MSTWNIHWTIRTSRQGTILGYGYFPVTASGKADAKQRGRSEVLHNTAKYLASASSLPGSLHVSVRVEKNETTSKEGRQ